MKNTIKPVVVTLLIATLSACCTTKGQVSGVQTTQLAKQQFAAVEPFSVQHLTSTPKAGSYQKIANISVNNLNFFGHERQVARIDDILDHVAANMGGNALINIHEKHNKTLATVIRLTPARTAKG